MENTQTEVAPELTEYEQEMIAKADAAEAKAKAQADPANAPAMEPEEEPKEEIENSEESTEEVKPKEEPKGLDIEKDKEPEKEEQPTVLTPEDMDKYNREFIDKGALSEETYKELEAKGYSKDVVDAYVEGQAALRELSVNKVYDSVGGKEAYSNMIEFAKENWTDAQIEGYNKAVNSGDEAQIAFAVESLKSQYEAQSKNPIPKRPLKGTSGGTSGGTKGFANKSEMMQAMRDPRYYKDASYNKMVMERVAISNF